MRSRLTRHPLSLLILLLLIGASTGNAQQEEAGVEEAVHRLFDAMRAADGVAASDLFRSDARLHSVEVVNGETRLVSGDVGAFLQAVGAARTEVWDERIWDLEVEVDGDLATAWMNYAFYVDDRFSHCGVNAFQFVRTTGDWQILQITDTRRRAGCEAPA